MRRSRKTRPKHQKFCSILGRRVMPKRVEETWISLLPLEDEMTDESTFKLGKGFMLRVYRELELEESADASDGPGVTIEMRVKSRDDDGGELSLIRIGYLEEENVGALISA